MQELDINDIIIIINFGCCYMIDDYYIYCCYYCDLYVIVNFLQSLQLHVSSVVLIKESYMNRISFPEHSSTCTKRIHAHDSQSEYVHMTRD